MKNIKQPKALWQNALRLFHWDDQSRKGQGKFILALKAGALPILFSNALHLGPQRAFAYEQKLTRQDNPKNKKSTQFLSDSLNKPVPAAEDFWKASKGLTQLKAQLDYMPVELRAVSNAFINDIRNSYSELSQHQIHLLNKEAMFTGRVLSKKNNPERFDLIHQVFKKQFEYVKGKIDGDIRYAFFVNAAPRHHGGQMAYLINLTTGVMLEVSVSTGWTGVGFDFDSGETPVGYFLANDDKTTAWDSKTMLAEIPDMFGKLQHQEWIGPAKWLHRVDTKKEKAYILSNQLALKGMNDGLDSVPLTAVEHYPKLNLDPKVNNENSSLRHLYIHGTNREPDQLGRALSGGCVRVDNLFSFIIGKVYTHQQNRLPVFIDAIRLIEGPDDSPNDPEDNELEPDELPLSQFTKTSESYKGLGQFDFELEPMLARMKNKIDNGVVLPIVDKVVKRPLTTVNVLLSASIPFPETAMLDWLKYKKNLAGYASSGYRHTFDLFANHHQSTAPHDPALHANILVKDAKELVAKRLDKTSEYIARSIGDELANRGVEVFNVKKSVNITRKPILMKDETGKGTDIGFDIDQHRRRVLDNMSQLDSFAQKNPSKFETVNELKWISSYLTQKSQKFESKTGETVQVYEVKYEHALLAQAYIYALGELELRKYAYINGQITTEDDPMFYVYFKKIWDQGFRANNRSRITFEKDMKWLDQYKDLQSYDQSTMFSVFDIIGQKKLVLFSHSNDTKINAKFALGNLKQNTQRVLGIIQISEEIFSREKYRSNKLTIDEEIPLELLLNKDGSLNQDVTYVRMFEKFSERRVKNAIDCLFGRGESKTFRFELNKMPALSFKEMPVITDKAYFDPQSGTIFLNKKALKNGDDAFEAISRELGVYFAQTKTTPLADITNIGEAFSLLVKDDFYYRRGLELK